MTLIVFLIYDLIVSFSQLLFLFYYHETIVYAHAAIPPEVIKKNEKSNGFICQLISVVCF